MAKTPLYKRLKENGNSTYVFPGVAEDISAAYQNSNYKMYFSKYVLLDLPKRESTDLGGTQSNTITYNFGTFSTVAIPTSASFGDSLVESLRNYVANHEVSLRESRLNNTEYYYDTTALETTSEKIFWKWCKKLNLISFDLANPQDEYFDTLTEFDRTNVTDDTYFPEYLWIERKVIDWNIIDYYEAVAPFTNTLALETSTITNIRVGDIIELVDFSTGGLLPVDVFGSAIWSTITLKVLDVTTNINNQLIVVDFPSTLSSNAGVNIGTIRLKYHKLVKYIGEVNGISNVQEANRSYTEVYAHIPDHTGETPDILFRTKPDVNYRPGLAFPLLPSQYQPEIMGAELFSSPIVSNPTEYPGGYYGQYDSPDFTYEVESGDSLRRRGRFYGVFGDINARTVNGDSIDGITMDFNKDHYTKMNITNREVINFDQFNALEVNGEPPIDFEFNAILWYYTVEDLNGNQVTNMYGISFLDNPDNNQKSEEVGIRFPTYRKLVSNGNQDGTSYAFSLNLNFNIINDNPQEAYNPEAINSLFSMNLFNESMSKLSYLNETFMGIIGENNELKEEIVNIKQLVYNQTDIDTIKGKITNLENLLTLYSTQQIVSSDSIVAEYLNTSPSTLKLNNIDPMYNSIRIIETSNMYDVNGIIPVSVIPPLSKNFLVKILNNDEQPVVLPNNETLSLLITKDLAYKQTMDMYITSTDTCSENKKLDIYISTTVATASSVTQVESVMISNIDLPVFYNIQQGNLNSASTWRGFGASIDFTQDITILPGGLMELSLDGSPFVISNSVMTGDEIVLKNLFIGTQSIFDFSGQYRITAVTSPTITVDVSTNVDFMSWIEALPSIPHIIHTSSTSDLSSIPWIDLNRGYRIRITRISEQNDIPLVDKYFIDVSDLKY